MTHVLEMFLHRGYILKDHYKIEMRLPFISLSYSKMSVFRGEKYMKSHTTNLANTV